MDSERSSSTTTAADFFSVHLEKIWSTAVGRTEVARRILEGFAALDWVVLSAVDVATTYEIKDAMVVVADTEARICTSSGASLATIRVGSPDAADPKEETPLILYEGFGHSVRVQGLHERGHSETHDPCMLLLALTEVHFHGDSIVLLPGDLRELRLKHTAESFGVSVSRLRGLFHWLNAPIALSP